VEVLKRIGSGCWGATEQKTGLRAYGKGITTNNSVN